MLGKSLCTLGVYWSFVFLGVFPLSGNDQTVARLSIEAWKSVLGLNYRPAERIFREIAEDNPNAAREANFSRAAILLCIQPRTSRNVERAYALFEEVAAKDPNYELGLEARYFLALQLEQLQSES